MNRESMCREQNFDPGLCWRRKPIGIRILLGIIFTIAGAGLIGLFGLVIMKLWNSLMPEIFGLPLISYWQGWGLFLLSFIFFKGFGGGHRQAEHRRKTQLRRHIHTVMEAGECDDQKESSETTDASE